MAELLSEARDELKAAGRSTEDVNWRWALVSDIRTDSNGPRGRSKGAPAGVSVVVVGLSHRTVPVSVLEPMTVPAARLPKALRQLGGSENASEVALVSTCLRTEIYFVAHRYHRAVADARDFFASWSGLPPEAFASYLYEYYDDVAVGHLFKVAAGLDSAVLGEGEILGQIGDAWEAAHAEGVSGPVLAILFRHAVEVGKRVRSETAIARGTTSLSQAAVALATERVGSLSGLTTAVMGAGEMGEAMARALAGSIDNGELLVINRTYRKATELAARCGGRALQWSDLAVALGQADVLLACTGSPELLVVASDVAEVVDRRRGRPLLVVELAVPRNVDPAVGELPGVTVLDMDELAAFASRGMASRRREVPRAEQIVAEEIGRYSDRSAQRHVAPLIGALYERAEEIRAGELARFRRRLDNLDQASTQAVGALTRGIVAKLLHDPTAAVRSGVGTPTGEQLAQALRQLFDL
jgi:glutamyl-tRNA reductase